MSKEVKILITGGTVVDTDTVTATENAPVLLIGEPGEIDFRITPETGYSRNVVAVATPTSKAHAFARVRLDLGKGLTFKGRTYRQI